MSIANPTLEDVWRLFGETDRLLKEQSTEMDRRFQETDRRFQETERLMKAQSAETERLLKEQSAETERLMKAQSAETERLLKEQSEETDHRFQATERLIKEQSIETDRKIKKVTEAIGDLGNRLGEFVENAVRPAAVRLFQEHGIAVHEVYRGVSVQRDNEGLEIDLLVVNDQDAILIECKSNISVEHIKRHLKRLDKVKRLMPKYANSRIRGAVASMVLTDDIVKYTYHKGLYVIGPTGTDLTIYNDDKFVPKIW